MPLVESVLAPLRDPQLAAKLAAHATGPAPAWLWSTDGSRIIWANAVGAAIFGAADAGECQERRFGAKDATAAQIVRLAATLPTSGQPRLERLRGFGADFGRALTCVCSRLILADGTPVVLIIATEPAGPPLPLRERVRRLLADRRRALAAFAREGTLLYATEPALTRFVGTATLSTLGVDAVAAPALVNGSASGATPYGPVTVERLGSDASTVLVLMFAARAGEIPAEQTPAEASAPVPSPAPAPSDAEAPSSPLPAPEAPAAAPAPLDVEAPPSSRSVQEVPATAPAPLHVEAPPSPPAPQARRPLSPRHRPRHRKRSRTVRRRRRQTPAPSSWSCLLPKLPQPTLRRASAAIRCASSGRWMRTAASPSARTSSSSSWGRARRRRSAGCGARSPPN